MHIELLLMTELGLLSPSYSRYRRTQTSKVLTFNFCSNVKEIKDSFYFRF